MKKQLKVIFASLLLASTLSVISPAQDGRCKLNEDGTTDCPPDLPPIKGNPRPTGPSGTSASISNMTWVTVFLRSLRVI